MSLRHHMLLYAPERTAVRPPIAPTTSQTPMSVEPQPQSLWTDFGEVRLKKDDKVIM